MAAERTRSRRGAIPSYVSEDCLYIDIIPRKANSDLKEAANNDQRSSGSPLTAKDVSSTNESLVHPAEDDLCESLVKAVGLDDLCANSDLKEAANNDQRSSGSPLTSKDVSSTNESLVHPAEDDLCESLVKAVGLDDLCANSDLTEAANNDQRSSGSPLMTNDVSSTNESLVHPAEDDLCESLVKAVGLDDLCGKENVDTSSDADVEDDDLDTDYCPPSVDSDSSTSGESVVFPYFNKQYPEMAVSSSTEATVMDENSTIPLPLGDKSVSSSLEHLSKITVQATSNTDGRVYDKRFYCLFCGKAQAKMPRHLTTQHKEETVIVKYVAETDRKVQQDMMLKLRNLGNHRHNIDVIQKQEGDLIVAYRPATAMTSATDYIPCEHCLGYYVASELWKHVRRCPLAPENSYKPHRRVQNASRLLLPSPSGTSIGLHSVLSTMVSDEVGQIVKGDRLILLLGEKLFLKNGHDSQQYTYIRNVLRELGRLLKVLRTSPENTNKDLTYFMDPVHFKAVVDAARQVAGFSETTHKYQTPSLALKLGHSVKKCAKITKGKALQTGDEESLRKSTAFFELCELDWMDEVSTHAHRTLNDNKRNKAKLIPLTEDVTAFTKYLKKVGAEAYEMLKDNNKDSKSWATLNETTLCQIILFNRRRAGEASKMTLDDYNKKQIVGDSDVIETLSPLEKKLCQVIERVEIIGKRGRTVPVLITDETKKWAEMLQQTRKEVGVHPENTFLFACSHYGSLGHIRGSDVVRAYSESCGAKYPELLRSTKLRKQIGTLSQILNLKENELDILSNFLGHDIRVHREFYRLPQETLQVAKVSKLLLCMERGQFVEQQGKSLDQIEVDIDEEILSEDELGHEEGHGDAITARRSCRKKRKIDEHDNENSGAEQSTLAIDEDLLEDDLDDGIATAGIKPVKDSSKKRIWTDAEKAAVMRHFAGHVALGKIPIKREVDRCVSIEPALKRRKWRNIKDYVRNKIKTNKSKKLF